MDNRILVTSILYHAEGNYSASSRFESLAAILQAVEESSQAPDVLIFPAGFLKFHDEKEKIDLISRVQGMIKIDTCVCLGIDSYDGRHQLGILLSKKGIKAMGRKYFPTDWDTKAGMIKATDYLAREEGYERVFTLKTKRIYIAVCNDIKGITALNLEQPQPRVDVVVDLIHGFNKKGGGSSPPYFARTMANSAQKWQCSVIGSAVFFDRDIPSNWPAGIKLKSYQKDMRKWNYENNLLEPLTNNSTKLASLELKTYKL